MTGQTHYPAGTPAPAISQTTPATGAENQNTTPVGETDNVADFAQAQERQNRIRFDLSYPVESADGEVKELWMRRPTLLDKVVAERRVKDNNSYEKIAIMLAQCCGVDEDIIWEMDEEYDLRQLVDTFNELEEDAETEGDNTLVLKYPFEHDGQRIERITLRRPKARDSLEFGDEDIGEKIARLAGFELKDLHEMDLKTDWLGLESVYLSFRKRKPGRSAP